MKRLLFLPLLALPLLILSCDSPTDVPGSQDAADAALSRSSNPHFYCWTQDWVVQCPLEDIDLDVQICGNETELQNGEIDLFTVMGWGEGLSSGYKYAIRWIDPSMWLENENAIINEGSFHALLIGVGQAPDYMITGVFHRTDANGETRVDIDRSEGDCGVG